MMIVMCPMCHGKKKIPGRSEAWKMFLYECDLCKGEGQVTEETAREWEDQQAVIWNFISPPRP
jgi:DnaJ-class molecular chaperone